MINVSDMPYLCQFCGDIEEAEVVMKCGACGGEKIARAALGSMCAECENSESLVAHCPICGSDEIEA